MKFRLFLASFHEVHSTIVVLGIISTKEILEGNNFGKDRLCMLGMSKKLVSNFILSFNESAEDDIVALNSEITVERAMIWLWMSCFSKRLANITQSRAATRISYFV